MAKQGIHFGQLTHLLQERATTPGWALCIGAGTSLPAFPDWSSLVHSLLARDVPAPELKDVHDNLAIKYSPDALIQAAQDRLRLDDLQFATQLADELYSRLRGPLKKADWSTVARALTARAPGDLKKEVWEEFVRIVDAHFPGSGAAALAPVLASVVQTDRAPRSILSFNAEPFFYALTNAAIARLPGNPRAQRSRPQAFDKVTHSISTRKRGRIPYYFCHGLLPIPGRRLRPHDASIDKLVFSESSYLALANTSFAWQSATFIDICLTRSLVFIGLSLSDSNMRRWLSWVHSNRIREIATLHGHHGDSTVHLWLHAEPASASHKRWLESLVAHLGVRLVWLPDWSHSGNALRILLGV